MLNILSHLNRLRISINNHCLIIEINSYILLYRWVTYEHLCFRQKKNNNNNLDEQIGIDAMCYLSSAVKWIPSSYINVKSQLKYMVAQWLSVDFRLVGSSPYRRIIFHSQIYIYNIQTSHHRVTVSKYCCGPMKLSAEEIIKTTQLLVVGHYWRVEIKERIMCKRSRRISKINDFGTFDYIRSRFRTFDPLGFTNICVSVWVSRPYTYIRALCINI